MNNSDNTKPTWVRRRITRIQPFAKDLKELLQFIVGLVVVSILFAKFVQVSTNLWQHPDLSKYKSLDILSEGLVYAAALELAYLLLTEELDEAVRVSILAIAAAVPLAVKIDGEVGWELGFSLLSLVVAMGALFYIRDRFKLDSDKPKPRVRRITTSAQTKGNHE